MDSVIQGVMATIKMGAMQKASRPVLKSAFVVFALIGQTLIASPLQLDVAVEEFQGKLICTASVTNVSNQQVELASIRRTTIEMTAALYKSTDTHWNSSMERDGGIWPIYYGHALFAGKESYRLSSLPKDLFDRIADNPTSASVLLLPGATQKLLIRNQIPDRPTSVALQFILKAGEKYKIEAVQWNAK